MANKPPVCVFCGSSPGVRPVYEASARSLGASIAESGRTLVYGGGVRGVMGFVAASCLEAGGKVHGIIPKALTQPVLRNHSSVATPSGTPEPNAQSSSSRGGETNGESKEGTGAKIVDGQFTGDRFTNEIVSTMHERKARMAEISQGGFIVLPGGFGTFEEVMEMTTWSQLGIQKLPVIVLNVNGFYSSLKELIQKAVEEGFISPPNASLIKIVDLQSGDDPMKDWGKRGMEALDGFVFDEAAGYGLSWKDESE